MKRSTGIVPGYIGPALPGIKFISEPDICVRHPIGCDFNINNQARIEYSVPSMGCSNISVATDTRDISLSSANREKGLLAIGRTRRILRHFQVGCGHPQCVEQCLQAIINIAGLHDFPRNIGAQK